MREEKRGDEVTKALRGLPNEAASDSAHGNWGATNRAT